MSSGQANRASPIRNTFVSKKHGFMKKIRRNNNYKIFILYSYDYEIKYFSNRLTPACEKFLMSIYRQILQLITTQTSTLNFIKIKCTKKST